MEKTINYNLELDGVELSVYGCYCEGMSGDYFNAPEPEEFEVYSVYIEQDPVDIDITDLIYNRIEEIESMIIEKYYR